jgi:hypothetical protein
MTLENAVRMFAGFIVLLSVALTYFVSPWWMLFTVFIGFNLIQSSITGLCPAEMVLRKLFYSNKGQRIAEVSSQES